MNGHVPIDFGSGRARRTVRAVRRVSGLILLGAVASAERAAYVILGDTCDGDKPAPPARMTTHEG